MSIGNHHSAAYDLSLFESDPKKPADKEATAVKPGKDGAKIIKLDTEKAEKLHRRKHNPVKIFFAALLTIALAAVSSVIVYNYVVINEQNEQILASNKVLENKAMLEAQYQLKIDSKLTTEIVENYAEQKLGMTKAKTAQKEFVALAEGDEGKVLRGDEKSNLLEKLGKLLHIS